MAELRRCEHCGKTEHLEVVRSDEMRIPPRSGADLCYTVMCVVAVGGRGEGSGCGASCGFYPSASEAIAAWNTRAYDAEHEKVCNRMKAVMHDLEREKISAQAENDALRAEMERLQQALRREKVATLRQRKRTDELEADVKAGRILPAGFGYAHLADGTHVVFKLRMASFRVEMDDYSASQERFDASETAPEKEN